MSNIMQWLAGTWFILGTNFPMWLGTHKTQPTFNYTITAHKGNPAMLDEVKYLKNGKPKTITGYDHAISGKPNAFVWRGKGILAIAKSKWEVRLQDPKGQWAVIWFSKTLFIPEGIDIIFRRKHTDETTLNYIKTKMQDDSLLKKHIPSLVIIR